ncbi:MAG: ABC transporter permease [Rhodospirillaceae bacterium]|nr:ABC transporter permease [Rhodospirillaceae bacterium]
MSLRRAAWRGVALLFVVFLLSPPVLVILFAFSDRPLANFPVTGLGLRWFRDMVRHPAFADALENSLVIGCTVGLVAAVVGTMAGIGFSRWPPRRARTWITVLCLPLMLPPLFLGVSLLVFYVFLGAPLGLGTVILSHLLFTLPFVIIVVYARMSSFDYRIVESARDLGASPMKAFLTVTLPVVQPVVIGAALIAVALSIDDFILTSFTIGGGNTLPILVWSQLRTNVSPMINAIGTMLLLTSIGSTLIALQLTRYRG